MTQCLKPILSPSNGFRDTQARQEQTAGVIYLALLIWQLLQSGFRNRIAVLTGILLIMVLPRAVEATSLQIKSLSETQRMEFAHLMSLFESANRGETGPSAISVIVGVDGEIAYEWHKGKLDNGADVSADTRFRIGSLTKQLTAASVLCTIEDRLELSLGGGWLSLETEIADIIGQPSMWRQPGQDDITVRSLLTMRSNLPNFTRRPPPHVDPWGAIPTRKLLSEIRKLVPSGWPSTFEYSNTNYFLLSIALDAVMSPPGRQVAGYEQQMNDCVFERANMRNSYFHGDPTERVMDPGKAAPVRLEQSAFNAPNWLRGSGDVVSSATDMFRWNRAFMTGRVVGAESRRLMMGEMARVTPTLYYGMGWFVQPEHDGWTYAFHTGLVPGYTSLNAIKFRADGRWTSATILTNSDTTKGIEHFGQQLARVAAGL